MPDADKELHYRIAYEEAVRALSQQQTTVESLRTRAGLLLSAAAVTITADPANVIETYIEAEEPAPIEELHRDLSLHMHDSYVVNQNGLGRLAVFFQVASGLLSLEVVLWLIAIASTS